jgi:hypothetical protein
MGAIRNWVNLQEQYGEQQQQQQHCSLLLVIAAV